MRPAVIVGAIVGLAVLLGAKPAVAAVRRRRYGDPTPWLPAIRRAASRHRELRNRVSVLVGLFDQESARYDPDVVYGRRPSPTGALGIGQFTRTGAAEVRRIMTFDRWAGRFDDNPGLKARLTRFQKEPDAADPAIAIEASALYLAFLISEYGSNVEAALTHYNAGGRAARLVASAGSHQAALRQLEALPDDERSQSPEYAPGVLARAEHFSDAGLAGAVAFGGLEAVGNYVRERAS